MTEQERDEVPMPERTEACLRDGHTVRVRDGRCLSCAEHRCGAVCRTAGQCYMTGERLWVIP
jgi:hypothetical protein